MTGLSAQVADRVGRLLHAEGFRPLPDVNDDGELIGTRLWRVRAGYVEYLALRPNGFAHAVRVWAAFDYRQPTEHGPVLEYRSGYVVNAVDWLLDSADAPASRLARPYAPPSAENLRRERDEGDGTG
ncbi:hypothetical protein [Gandjariella thermophila]|uniref:Uncharacterized protein n=1 Tax=Gandjariella thermophila TaxID=1931992 RepID=A0A4D4JB52_9PSEU|nr:hypothetical protein [Gandjariella thermophila]GDY33891.1 hypothetical protein GTS_55240 [Gandjariella thermophila]